MQYTCRQMRENGWGTSHALSLPIFQVYDIEIRSLGHFRYLPS